MTRTTRIKTEAQTQDIGTDNNAAPDVQPAKIHRPRRMARGAVTPQVNEVGAEEESLAEPITVQEAVPMPSSAHSQTSKIAKVIALLERGQGATLAELVEATGWQPHTTRAALTGLRNKGDTIAKDKRDEVTCYRIGVVA